MSFKGKKNIYLCTKCGHGFVTVDRDEGTTPMMCDCARRACGGMARSMMYAAPQEALDDIPAAYEWYKPGEPELHGKSAVVQDHVRRGGLILRERST